MTFTPGPGQTASDVAAVGCVAPLRYPGCIRRLRGKWYARLCTSTLNGGCLYVQARFLHKNAALLDDSRATLITRLVIFAAKLVNDTFMQLPVFGRVAYAAQQLQRLGQHDLQVFTDRSRTTAQPAPAFQICRVSTVVLHTLAHPLSMLLNRRAILSPSWSGSGD